MLNCSLAYSLLFAPIGPFFQAKSGEPAQTTEVRRITTDEARVALNKLMESENFLSDAPYMEPLKKRILAENNKDPILKASVGSSAPGGNFIGPWNVSFVPLLPSSRNSSTDEFFYYAKSIRGDELFTIRGHFLNGQENKWKARICEASVTKLSNFFGNRELAKIKEGMSIDEVIEILGTPPGAYFSGVMGFTYPGGRRHWPFTGTDKEFQKQCGWFFAPISNEKKDDWIDRAWISNDIAIWITFNEERKVNRKSTSVVRCPREEDPIRVKLREKLIKELMKPESSNER